MNHLLIEPANKEHFEERKKLIRTLFALWLKSGNDEHLNNALKVYDETREIFKNDQLNKTIEIKAGFFGYSKLKKVA